MCGPAARWGKKEARDTLALPAKGAALCTPYSMCGPAARWRKKEARDTLALPAKGAALCTPFMSECQF